MLSSFLLEKADCPLFLPGHQVFFWKKSNLASNLKGRRSRIIERWWGPGVVIGHEWDQTAKRDSYWVSYGGRCFMVANTHLRHPEVEECLSQENFMQEMKKAFDNARSSQFTFHDLRAEQYQPLTGDDRSPAERIQDMNLDMPMHQDVSRAPSYHDPGDDSEHMPRQHSRGASGSTLASVGEPESEQGEPESRQTRTPPVPASPARSTTLDPADIALDQ